MATAWALVRRGSAQAMVSRHVAKTALCCLGLMVGPVAGILTRAGWCEYSRGSLTLDVCQRCAGHVACAR